MKKTIKPQHLAPGFTLIEVMATLAILSIALVVLIKAQTQSVNNVRRVGTYEQAVFITENQLQWTILDLNQAENWEDYSLLEGDDQDGKFIWTVQIDTVDMDSGEDLQATMLRLVATTTWQEGRGESQFQLETYYLWGESQQ